MRRLIGFALVVVALAVAPAAVSLTRPSASVRLVACDAAAGSATFQARMAATRGTERMWMRFTLLERVGEGLFHPVSAPGLDVWRKSRPGVSRFVYSQELANLKHGSSYRVGVQHRWIGSDGATLRTVRRRSPTCAPSTDLPNLRVRSIEVRPGPQRGTSIYTVSVRNAGPAHARDIRVALTVDGTALSRVTVDLVRGLDIREIELTGPACASSLTAVIDPENTVRESKEDDNLRTAPCRQG